MLRSVSRSLSGGGTSLSVNLFRIFAGRSRLPTSVAGFIQAKILKLGCRGTGSSEPCSVNVIDDVSLCKSEETHSSVSGDARLTSSSNTLGISSLQRGVLRRLNSLTKTQNELLSPMVLQRTGRQTSHYCERAGPRSREHPFQIVATQLL